MFIETDLADLPCGFTVMNINRGIISELTVMDVTSSINESYLHNCHCLKSVCIRSFPGPFFPAFGLNTERYGVWNAECGKIRTSKTPNRDTFHSVWTHFVIKDKASGISGESTVILYKKMY